MGETLNLTSTLNPFIEWIPALQAQEARAATELWNDLCFLFLFCLVGCVSELYF